MWYPGRPTPRSRGTSAGAACPPGTRYGCPRWGGIQSGSGLTCGYLLPPRPSPYKPRPAWGPQGIKYFCARSCHQPESRETWVPLLALLLNHLLSQFFRLQRGYMGLVGIYEPPPRPRSWSSELLRPKGELLTGWHGWAWGLALPRVLWHNSHTSSFRQTHGSRLRLHHVSQSDSGEYVCRVVGGSGSEQEASFTVTVPPSAGSSYRE